nr:hypothetical protein [Tanacetum cinerariifolium]
ARTHCPPLRNQTTRRVKPMVTLVLEVRNPPMDQNQKINNPPNQALRQERCQKLLPPPVQLRDEQEQ